MANNLIPLCDRVVIKPESEEEVTKCGIFIPDMAKEKPQIGTVIAVGIGIMLDNGQRTPLEVKIGDKIIYSKYGGTEVKLDNEEYIILQERDILAVKI